MTPEVAGGVVVIAVGSVVVSNVIFEVCVVAVVIDVTILVLSYILIKQVRTNNDTAFQCNFLFNIFFILWMLSVLVESYYQIPIYFT